MKKTEKTVAKEQRDIEIEELKAGWQRAQADFENYKKRVDLERTAWADNAKIQVLKNLLPVLGNINLAVAHAPQDSAQIQWIEGIAHIARQIDMTLEELGISKIMPEIGIEFDPKIHEATRTEELANTNSGTIVKVDSAGYMLNGKVIAPAKVVVQK